MAARVIARASARVGEATASQPPPAWQAMLLLPQSELRAAKYRASFPAALFLPSAAGMTQVPEV